MPKLGEFIGALLSDAAHARVRADIETVKLAEVYSAHELLRHLPVPRFRMPDVTLEFPVVVSKLRGGGGDRILTEPPPEEVQQAIVAVLAESGIRLPNALRDKVVAAGYRAVNIAFAEGPELMLSPDRLSESVATAVTRLIGETVTDGPDKIEKLKVATRDAMRGLLAKRLAVSPYVEVRVESGEIKSHGDHEALLRVRLMIKEDDYEIIRRDEEGRGFLLVPE